MKNGVVDVCRHPVQVEFMSPATRRQSTVSRFYVNRPPHGWVDICFRLVNDGLPICCESLTISKKDGEGKATLEESPRTQLWPISEALLSSQRFDGVDSRSAACREVTCNKRGYHQNSRSAAEGGSIDGLHAKEQR